MIVFVILSVFIAGLMVGRTPEYLGKKIEAFDVKMAMLAVLIFPLVILGLDRRLRSFAKFGTSRITNPGPHGFRRFSTPTRRHRQQRLGLRRPQRKYALVQHHRSASPRCSAASSW